MGKKIEHNHLLINAKIKNYPTSTTKVKDFLIYLIEQIDMKIISGPHAVYVNKTGNRGMTASVMIETSHIAMHVWDETDPGFIQFDLYTCSTLPIRKVIDNIVETFGLVSYRYKVLERSEGFKIVPEDKWDTLT